MSAVNIAKYVVVIVVAVMDMFVLGPLVIYFLKGFNAMSESIQIRKRYPDILKFQAVGMILWFYIGIPIITTDWIELDIFKGRPQTTLTRINQLIWPWLTHLLFVTTAWRFWHIYYDLKYSSSQKNSEWKYHLDSNLVEHNFWLTHKKDFGSSKWTRRVIGTCGILSTVALIIIYQSVVDTDHFYYVGHGLSCVFHGVFGGAALGLWWKIPEYSDNFFIRYEMHTISLLFIGVVVVGGTGAVGAIFVGSVWGVIWSANVGTVLFFVIATLSFWWIPRKIRSEELRIKLLHLRRVVSTRAKLEDKVSERSVTGTMSTQYNQKKKNLQIEHIVGRLSSNGRSGRHSIRLYEILSNEKSFKLFMQHLAKEFSLETPLCFVEILQYKFEMKERLDKVDVNAIKTDMDMMIRMPIFDVVPVSRIVSEGFQGKSSEYQPSDDSLRIMHQAKHICLELYHKYIKNGSELEVNIGYDTKTRLTNLMVNEPFWIQFNIVPDELFCLYDDVATTMYRLMDGSFIRFKQTDNFKSAVQELRGH